jgi:hypothetical protein
VSPIQIASSLSPSEPQTQEVSSAPRSVPQPQEAPADVSGRIADPVVLGTSSVVPPEQTITIPPQGKVPITESLLMNLFICYNHSFNFSANVIPLATPADQTIVPAASPRQRQEITLKQVSYPIF